MTRENQSPMHLKTVRALVRYMRSQKVESFALGPLSIKFSPEAFLQDAPYVPAEPRVLDAYASDEEHEEDVRGQR